MTFNESVEKKAKELSDVVIKKQHDYGKGNVLNAPIDSRLATIVRLNDKVQRAANLIESDIDPENESLQDTALDIMGYGMILSMIIDDTFKLPLTSHRQGEVSIKQEELK